jgi:4,4'-diaponeurosporenoate glycosyltransferase
MAFGPVLAVPRDRYDAVGGHGHPDVRGSSLEDAALARAVGRSEVFTGHPDVRFRMHPDGWRDMFRGWVRNMGGGAVLPPWWVVLGVVAWVWSLAGGLFATPLAYPLSALQVWVLGRRVGRFTWWTALLYPVAVIVFVAMLARAAWLRLRGGSVVWKGRDIAG